MMKKVKLLPLAAAVLAIFSVILGACPELLEDPPTSLVFPDSFREMKGFQLNSPETDLDDRMWVRILEYIESKGQFVNLDLKKATHKSGNTRGGLIEVIYASEPYVAFDPLSSLTTGKDKIVSIILPDAARMINQAVTSAAGDREISEGEDILQPSELDRLNSAFRHFTNLKSVTAEGVEIIGNYAFIGITSLEKVSFPMVGRTVTLTEISDPTNDDASGFRVDVGHYAFYGCTGLTEISFNRAAVIGRSAFRFCTGLRRINFPNVWMVAENAFEGNTSLTEVRFENATKIGDESFKDCTNLRRVFLTTNQGAVGADLKPAPPTVAGGTIDVDYGSVVIYPGAFSGCRSLELLDIRNSWNVFFGDSALEKIGESLNLYLFDSATGTGHPQYQLFLGKRVSPAPTTVSLKSIYLYVPIITGGNISSNFTNFIKDHYSADNIDVNFRLQ
jgi:hypothetical protein